MVNYCLLDCCNSTAAGNPEFKGNYTFPTALARNVTEKDCEYSGKTKNVKAFSTCQTNMEVGPSYDSLNVKSCKAKYETTRVLDNLNEVRIFTLYKRISSVRIFSVNVAKSAVSCKFDYLY